VTRFAGGFSNLIDIAAGPDEALYLLQYSDDFFGPPSGRVLKLGLDGSVRTVFDDLVRPTGLAVGRDGTIYVANDGDGVNGQLLALTPSPVPGPLPLLGVGVAFAQARRLRRRCGGLSSARARRPAPPATASALDRPSPGG
jgi:DNA-binding beta-propeller fold protein YncE